MGNDSHENIRVNATLSDVIGRAGRLLVLAAISVSCSSDSGLRPFTSDGCSLFPDASLITKDVWCSCCFKHDLDYWRGGTSEERAAADIRLKDCVLKKTGNAALATLMYEGVRLGGSPYFYNWYRWGYGWSYDRKYQALTAEERQHADVLVEEYFSTVKQPVMPDLVAGPGNALARWPDNRGGG